MGYLEAKNPERGLYGEGLLVAVGRGAEIFAEEWHDMVLETVGYGAGVGAVVDLEGVGETIFVEDIVELAGVEAKVVLVAYVHGDGVILAQVGDVLIDEGEWGVGGPFGEDVGLRDAVFGGQVEIERRVLRVG